MPPKTQPITLNKLDAYISQFSSSDWEETPVSLQEFVESPDFLGLEPFTEIQLSDLMAFIGTDPKEFWTSSINECTLLYGKGAGKDTMASRLLTYACYLLLCLRNPQKYFTLSSTDWIDCINVAYSSDQAKYVFFDKLKQCFLRCQWFKRKYKVVVNPRIFGELTTFPNEIQIGTDRIFAPRGIRCFSEHAQNESWEGFNILFWVMDEACFSYDQSVLLDSGEYRPIGLIVNNKQPVDVLSYNFDTASYEICRVTNWFKYARQSPILKIKLSGSKSYSNIKQIKCTPNHQIYTDKGKVLAGDLKIGDLVFCKGTFLSPIQKEVVYGTLLGDGCLRKDFRSFGFVHGLKQFDYFVFKRNIFKKIMGKVGLNKSGYSNAFILKNGSIRLDNIDDVYANTLRNNKKTITPEWISNLTLLSLAIWYMDDGNLDKNIYIKKGHGKSDKNRAKTRGQKTICYNVIFNTHSFTKSELILLSEYLKSNGYDNSINMVHKKLEAEDKGYIIRLKKEATLKFLKDVSVYMPSSMQYKNIFPCAFSLSDTSSEIGLCPIISIEELSKSDIHNDPFVYDIEVEKTHNYLAKDVLVSNSSFLSKTKRENANAIYKTLRTSANSRFPNKWKGMILSFPREKDDFTCIKYEVAQSNPNMVGFKRSTWEVNPLKHPLEPSFDYNGMRVPMTLFNEFRDDPIDSMCKYACEPSEDNRPVDFDVVARAIYDRPMLLDYYSEPFTMNGETRIGNFIQKWNYDASFFRGNSFVAHYDLGESGDSATLCIGHKEASTVSLYKDQESGLIEVEAEKVIIDLIVQWTPDKKKSIKVSFLNAESFLEELINFGMRIIKLSYDQWNSGRSAEYFTARGLNVEKHNIDSDDYAFTISLLNSDLLGLPNLPIIKSEFKGLRREGGRFDHSKQTSKDVLDGICGVCRSLIGSKKAFGLQVISGYSGGASPNIRFNGSQASKSALNIGGGGVGMVRRNDGGNNARPIDFENMDMPRPEDFGMPSVVNKTKNRNGTQRQVPGFLSGYKGSW